MFSLKDFVLYLFYLYYEKRFGTALPGPAGLVLYEKKHLHSLLSKLAAEYEPQRIKYNFITNAQDQQFMYVKFGENEEYSIQFKDKSVTPFYRIVRHPDDATNSIDAATLSLAEFQPITLNLLSFSNPSEAAEQSEVNASQSLQERYLFQAQQRQIGYNLLTIFMKAQSDFLSELTADEIITADPSYDPCQKLIYYMLAKLLHIPFDKKNLAALLPIWETYRMLEANGVMNHTTIEVLFHLSFYVQDVAAITHLSSWLQHGLQGSPLTKMNEIGSHNKYTLELITLLSRYKEKETITPVSLDFKIRFLVAILVELLNGNPLTKNEALLTKLYTNAQKDAAAVSSEVISISPANAATNSPNLATNSHTLLSKSNTARNKRPAEEGLDSLNASARQRINEAGKAVHRPR